MGGVIFSQIKSLIGRTFVLAGLLPSALLIIGYYLYQFGGPGLLKLVDQFSLQATPPSAELNFILLLWLTFGVLFVSFRSVIFYFIVELPGALLKPLRYYLEARMLKKRKHAFLRKEENLFARTALEWRQQQQPFSDPKFIPPFITFPDKKQALQTSGIARRVVEYLADERYSPFHVPNRWQFRAIRKGLCDLYAFGSRHAKDGDYQQEISHWKDLMQGPAVDEILEHVSNTVLREYAVVRKYYSSFPENTWIKPTQVGNLVSALDDYSEKRYGIDTATLWTRIWWILSDSEKKEIMAAKFQVELLMNHLASILLILLAVLVNGVLSMFDYRLVSSALSAWGVVGYSLLMVMVCVILYRGSVFAFLSLKDKTISLIDLYRHQLLKKLGYIPANVEQEIALYQELHAFFVQGHSRDSQRKIQFNVPEEKSDTGTDKGADKPENKKNSTANDTDPDSATGSS